MSRVPCQPRIAGGRKELHRAALATEIEIPHVHATEIIVEREGRSAEPRETSLSVGNGAPQHACDELANLGRLGPANAHCPRFASDPKPLNSTLILEHVF